MLCEDLGALLLIIYQPRASGAKNFRRTPLEYKIVDVPSAAQIISVGSLYLRFAEPFVIYVVTICCHFGRAGAVTVSVNFGLTVVIVSTGVRNNHPCPQDREKKLGTSSRRISARLE